jgi:hypothetical protein
MRCLCVGAQNVLDRSCERERERERWNTHFVAVNLVVFEMIKEKSKCTRIFKLCIFFLTCSEINDHGDSLRWPRDILYPLKLALTSPTSGGRSVCIVHCRTTAPGIFLYYKARSGNMENLAKRPVVHSPSVVGHTANVDSVSSVKIFIVLTFSIVFLVSVMDAVQFIPFSHVLKEQYSVSSLSVCLRILNMRLS